MPNVIAVIHGPNLNLLGTRETDIYGSLSLTDIDQQCIELGSGIGFEVNCFQSNHEGTLIDYIHDVRESAGAIVINPAGYTHTSVALRDALAAVNLPIFEVHLSNIYTREPFRHHSYVSPIARGVICGFGAIGYQLAIRAAVDFLHKR